MNTRFYPLVAVWIGLFCAIFYMISTQHCLGYCELLQQSFSDGTMLEPLRFRVMAPVLAGLISQDNPIIGYVAIHLFVMPLLCFLLFKWFQRNVSDNLSLAGVGMFAIYFPLALHQYSIQVYTPIEIVFFLIALLYRRLNLLSVVLVALATLNRETALFMVGIFAITNWDKLDRFDFHSWFWLILCALAWAVVYVSLRPIMGRAEPLFTLARIWQINTQSSWNIAYASVFNLLLLPIWGYAIAGYRKASLELKHLGGLSLICFALFLVFGLWDEVRLLMFSFVFVLPLTLCQFGIIPKNMLQYRK